MKTLDINALPALDNNQEKAVEIKALDLADLPAIDVVYENAAEELAAKTGTGQYDEFAILPHINPELTGRVW